MSEDVAYVPEVKAAINVLNKEKEELQDRINEIDAEISELKVGQSPIKPGDLINWFQGGRVRRGRVVKVICEWSERFRYRVHILSQANKELGTANVTEDHQPQLEETPPTPKAKKPESDK